MKRALPAALFALALAVPAAYAGLGDFFRKATETLQQSSGEERGSERREATAAVRGLEEDAGGSGEASARDFDALKWLEKIQVTPEDLKRFVSEGRLAP